MLQGYFDNHGDVCILILAVYLKHRLGSTSRRLLAREDNSRYNQHARAPSTAICTNLLRQHLLFSASFTATPQIFLPGESSSSASQCHSRPKVQQISVPATGQLCKEAARAFQELSDPPQHNQLMPTCSLQDFALKVPGSGQN